VTVLVNHNSTQFCDFCQFVTKNCIYLVVGVRSVSKEPHQHAQLITGLHVKVFDRVLYV